MAPVAQHGPVKGDLDLRRPLAWATFLTWAFVTAPVLPQLEGPLVRTIGWGLASIVFVASTLAALRVRLRAVRLGLLALATLAVAGLVLLACDGFEGALLVLVAVQLGGVLPRRRALAWIAAQSVLIGGCVAVHWDHSAALLLTPPYLGFAVLAFLMADVLAAGAAARRELARKNAELSQAHRQAAEHGRLAERLRIARELHDSVGHRLTALGMHLEVVVRQSGAAPPESVLSARELARGALGDLRTAVERLRDEDRIDVASALRMLAADIPAPRVHLCVPERVCRDDPAGALTLLRLAQEILTNAVRHSQASNVWIDVAAGEEGIELSARDDGIGAAVVQPGNGLRGMRERLEGAGGHLQIATASGSGFHLTATLPVRRAP